MRPHATPLADQLSGFLRFAVSIRPFLRHTITAAEARRRILSAMRSRESAFLELANRAVYSNPRSPYLTLLHHAGCTQADLQSLVQHEGLEGALRSLYEQGVYVTFDEFKGRAPAFRGSATFRFDYADFDNPLIHRHFEGTSGGSSGRPGRVRFDVQHIDESAPHWAVWLSSHGISGRPLVYWTPEYAAVASGQLRYAKVGLRFVKWFSMGAKGDLHDRVVRRGIHTLLRWLADFPKPDRAPISAAGRVAEYVHGLAKREVGPCVAASPSASARISLAAQAKGISLSGVTFLLRAEPLTEARKSVIEASGAKAIQTYGFSEGGTVGSQCPNPAQADDIHVYRDAYAVISRPLDTRNGDSTGALLLTALRPSCPKVLINTDIGDYATVEKRTCGCSLDDLGYDLHLHTVRSYQKLTGEGVTFHGADIYRLLEEVLPHHFGGNLTHYQLVEDQDAHALPRYALRIHPKLGPLDEETVVGVFLRELGAMRGVYQTMASVWEQAHLLEVRREPPELSHRGKLLPFWTLQRR